MSNRVQCASSLRQIGQAMAMYSNNETRNGNAFPRTYFHLDAPLTQIDAGSTTPSPGYNQPASFADSGSPSPVGENNVMASMFLLLKTQDLKPGVFNCPSTGTTPDSFGATSAGGTPWTNYSCWDAPANRCLSYSMQVPFLSSAALNTGAKWNAAIAPDVAVLADINPGVPELTTISPSSSRAQIQAANSPNHDREGQNVPSLSRPCIERSFNAGTSADNREVVFRLLTRFRSAPAQAMAPRVPTRPPADLADLLGRPSISLDTRELQRFLAGKRVLVTGAGGSIGSEICRQTMRFCPERLIMVERAENALFEIDRELRHVWVGADLRPCIGDVCDARRVRQLFDAERPQVVFHCAAHKHVPMMEAHPCEAIKNNVFGTKTVADASLDSGVAAFVLVSTDKAVNPTSVMGATKRVAELYVQSLNDRTRATKTQGRGDAETRGEERVGPARSTFSIPASPRLRVPASSSIPSTRFLAVRFGNVLGSSGSVVPIFQKQIEAGGPVTVTHPDMTRYFMTIPEASQLVMQAGAIGQGGEIFVLDMGAQVRIVDLAMELIRRNGLRPNDDIEIRFTGIRPGEKLYEELAGDDEQTCPTAHEKIRVWKLPPADAELVAHGMNSLDVAAQTGSAQVAIAALVECVPEYRPESLRKSSRTESARPVPTLRLTPPDAEAA